MAGEILTVNRLRELLDYDPETGNFTWLKCASNRAPVGAVAGALNRVTGYTSISIDSKLHRAHRLAWLYMTGEWPERLIDHRNGHRSDNRWVNLRQADSSLNQQNMRFPRGETHSGILGVYRTDKKAKPWRASIKIGGADRHLGNFETKQQAKAAYLKAKRSHHEGCMI